MPYVERVTKAGNTIQSEETITLYAGSGGRAAGAGGR